MGYLDTLNRAGIRASIRRGDTLWLDPQYLVTSKIAEIVRLHKDDLLAEIRRCAADTADDAAEIVPSYRFMWVATDLDSFEEYDPRFGYELDCDPVYRMLDAAYYAWLRHRMENARKSHESGRLDDGAFEVLRTRFNIVHEWAVLHIGEDALRRAIRSTNVKTYVPPSEQIFAAYRKIWDDAWNACEQRRAAASLTGQSAQARRLQHLLDTQGYACIRSSVVEDIIVFVQDDSVAVPAKWSGKVQFTIDELRLMAGSSPEAVKQVYEVKRVFGGKVVPSDEPGSRLFPESTLGITTSQQLALEHAV
ncbi:MAG: hypothetical protein GX139_08060 [Armatimonadetes bacterium]|jgi:hypothetical protein|nr:hypothetical protein [Armatimonadota bacterium]